MKIITHGRTDLQDLFKISGILDKKLVHNPILCFVPVDDETMDIKIYDEAIKVVSEISDDSIQCMAQWAGKWRSDFFKFTVGDLRKALSER